MVEPSGVAQLPRTSWSQRAVSRKGVIEQAHIELSTVLNLYYDMAITFWLLERRRH